MIAAAPSRRTVRRRWWHAQASVRAPGAAQAEAARKPIPDFSTQFVTFGLWWNESSMYTYVLDERPGFLPVEQRVLDLTPKMSGARRCAGAGLRGARAPSRARALSRPSAAAPAAARHRGARGTARRRLLPWRARPGRADAAVDA